MVILRHYCSNTLLIQFCGYTVCIMLLAPCCFFLQMWMSVKLIRLRAVIVLTAPTLFYCCSNIVPVLCYYYANTVLIIPTVIFAQMWMSVKSTWLSAATVLTVPILLEAIFATVNKDTSESVTNAMVSTLRR